MKTGTKLAAAMLLGVLALAGCSGGKKADVQVDVQKLADSLKGTVTSEELTAAQESMIPTIYLLDAGIVKSSAGYMNSGATACEVAVIECGDAKDTETVKKAFETRVSSQTDLYASYNAGEADKLKKAVIDTEGCYAVLCVTDDADAAEKIIKDAGF